VTQLAREIPTSPAHPIKKTEHETISIHTQITEITVTKKKKEFSPLKCIIQHMILGNRKSPPEALHQERDTGTHQNTETPISAPKLNTKMPHWITNRKYKITSSPAASEKVGNGTGPGLGLGRKSSILTLPPEGPGSEGATARPSAVSPT
jgi:hypothetical protein